MVPDSRQRELAAAVIVASVGFVVAAELDLRGRADEELRGSRRLWQIVCTNALGAVLYARVGRR